LIEAQGLGRAFGGRQVVSDVSFSVAGGEVVGFLGPNGAGKTTTIRMLLGLLRPSAGVPRLDARVGYLPEAFAAYGALSVQAYLRFMCGMKRVPAAEAERAMAAARIGDLARRPFGRLSKGQKQRVGIAQALLGRPRAYVLDEPTQGLDPKQVLDARRLIRSLAADDGAAVLLSTHLLAEAATVCDRVVVLVGGRVVAEERPGDTKDLERRFVELVGKAQLK
jgi:ABC-2 type transport system ATP-binding protein